MAGRALTLRVAMGAATLLAGSLLSACGGNAGLGYARQACAHVERSIALLKQSDQVRSTDPVQGASLTAQAQAELLQALPLASAATEQSGNWQPLRTTLSEANRVQVSSLVPALTTQCAATRSGGPR
ncbi:MAG: hypothetical protein ACYCS7_01325 [Acidimicrobiales bacterium]